MACTALYREHIKLDNKKKLIHAGNDGTDFSYIHTRASFKIFHKRNLIIFNFVVWDQIFVT